MDFISENYEWIFSGIGVLIISAIFVKAKLNNKQKQKSGKKSKNYQAGRDIKIKNDER